MIYNIRFVFFIPSCDKDAVKRKDELIERIDRQDWIEYLDVYDDGDDWNIECDAEIDMYPDNRTDIDDQIDDYLRDLIIDNLRNETFDYHYIEGVDNGFYWEP